MDRKREHKIYKYTNKINGKVYIGRTCTTLEKRARNGEGYRCCTYFYSAIQKYRWKNFEPEIIKEDLTAEEASKEEIFYIEKFDSANPNKGYNIVKEIHSDFSEKTRKKLSERNKKENNPRWGKHISEEHKEKIREANRKRVITEETREKLREYMKVRYRGENHPMYGRHHSEEAKKKVSKANKGRPAWNKGKSMYELKPDYIHPMLGKTMPEETKKKLSIINKGRSNDKIKKAVICIETDIRYKGITDAAKDVGCDTSELCKCCRGKRKTAGGYHWKYADE